MSKIDNFTIILCPTVELAKALNPDVTIEAEYGDICVEGSVLTLAHHGSRSSNPAPCNTDVKPLTKGIIVISHMDLDTIGGIMAVVGEKIKDDAFWKAAEVIDVKGPHHLYKFPQEIQDKFNALYAWQDTHSGKANSEAVDVKERVRAYFDVLHMILDEDNEHHAEMIEKGREWGKAAFDRIESKLIMENKFVRVFVTDGIFCSGAYYSPSMDTIVPCTVVYNTSYKIITVAFEDGGNEDKSARKIVQELWGNEAGGRDGIAGSPRGVEMSESNFKDAIALAELYCKYK